jgi:hypothetical protein
LPTPDLRYGLNDPADPLVSNEYELFTSVPPDDGGFTARFFLGGSGYGTPNIQPDYSFLNPQVDQSTVFTNDDDVLIGVNIPSLNGYSKFFSYQMYDVDLNAGAIGTCVVPSNQLLAYPAWMFDRIPSNDLGVFSVGFQRNRPSEENSVIPRLERWDLLEVRRTWRTDLLGIRYQNKGLPVRYDLQN